MLKGLPLAYNKDMQEDKEAVFDTFDTVSACLEVTATVLRNLSINEQRTRDAASAVTDATGWQSISCARHTFSRSTRDSGRIVVARESDVRLELHELTIEEMHSFSVSIENDVFTALSLERTLEQSHKSAGTSTRMRN